MQPDYDNHYRPLLERNPPPFFTRVDTPWDAMPDVRTFNAKAYRRIERGIRQVEEHGTSVGLLVLGQAGTGKTHLLMRAARHRGSENHVVFVRRPNNEEAVAVHVWANVVHSLSRTLASDNADRTSGRPQLDDLLAHVLAKVLIAEFTQDIAQGTDVQQRERWVRSLRADAHNLFDMLGEGEYRTRQMNTVRRRVLQHFKVHHPDVDQGIAYALITYCFVRTPERRRLLLAWLSGEDISEAEARQLGVPSTWVPQEEDSSDASISQQREEHALRAIRTIGILAQYYNPLILAFDQLEGLRGEERLTSRWGDVVREIFTMTPNMLIVTCIFPDLWETWFTQELDDSAIHRIAQNKIQLEPLTTDAAEDILAAHLESTVRELQLPDRTYPFDRSDIDHLAQEAKPRLFLLAAKDWFEDWLDADIPDAASSAREESTPATNDDRQVALANVADRLEQQHRQTYAHTPPMEDDLFGRLRDIFRAVASGDGVPRWEKLQREHYVMPRNFVIRNGEQSHSLAVAVLNGGGHSFAARARNLLRRLREGDSPHHVFLFRDARSPTLGPKGVQYLEELEQLGVRFSPIGGDEMAALCALHEALVAVQEHDVTAHGDEVTEDDYAAWAPGSEVATRNRPLARALVTIAPGEPIDAERPPAPEPSAPAAAKRPAARRGAQRQDDATPHSNVSDTIPSTSLPFDGVLQADMVVGDSSTNVPHLGILGELGRGEDGPRLAVALNRPQCMAVLGYMGSGKSYALGVLIENALLQVDGITQNQRPLSVVAFNYRKNPDARFEYGGFLEPNDSFEDLGRLRHWYGARPAGVEQVNVFAFQPELNRRKGEYAAMTTRPILFRPDELRVDHWMILMKPPSANAEYMEIIRDIIQTLFYDDRLTFENLEQHVLTDERLSPAQRRRAKNRLSFAEKWLSDERGYEWEDVLQPGVLNVMDLRAQAMSEEDALRICLVVTDLVRRARNGVNKLVVFDEAHEYLESKQLVPELENAITQIRHDGLSFILASQYPDRIPHRLFKYLSTRLIFKLQDSNSIHYLRRAAPHMDALSPQAIANLELEAGRCFIQSDDDVSDRLLKTPQPLKVRPRCTKHGGRTVRHEDGAQNTMLTDH